MRCAWPVRSTFATTVSPARSSVAPTGNRAGPSALHDPTIVAVRAPSYCTTLATGSSSSRPTSSVTRPNRRVGSGSPATSVATRRSAACSAASSRWDASAAASARFARLRSAVTAASSSEVRADTAMKSCVDSRLSVIDSRTNGPFSCAVFQTVTLVTTRTAAAAPRGPKRSADQSTSGKTM
jgi:hypothetical protein